MLVFVVVGLVFGRLVACGFTGWDDPDTVSRNARLAPPTWANVGHYWGAIGRDAPGQLYVPLTYTLWSGLAWACGGKPTPGVFHGANVLLHAGAAAVVCRLLWRLFRNPWAAAAGALAFAVHPVQVESVGWASGTKDVLGGLLAASALLAYVGAVDGRRVRWGRYAAGLVLYLLAMVAKPGAVVVPVLAAAVDGLVLGRAWRRVAGAVLPWVALAVPCLIGTAAAQRAGWAEPVPVVDRPVVAADAVAFDVDRVLWPDRLGIDYGRRPAGVVASGASAVTWVVPAALVGLAVWAWRRREGDVAAAVVLFAVPIGPVSGLVPFEFQQFSTVADHYLYLPMVGVAVAVAWVVGRWRTRAVRVGTVAVLVAWGVRSVVQEGVWRDTVRLATNAVAVNPASWVGHGLLGDAADEAAYHFARDGNGPAARAAIERAMAEYAAAVDRNPAYVPAMVMASVEAGRLGRADERRKWLRRVVDVQPRLPAALRADPAELRRWAAGEGSPAR